MDEHLCYGWTFKLWKFINFEIVEERERTEHIGQIKQDDLIKFPTHQKRKKFQQFMVLFILRQGVDGLLEVSDCAVQPDWHLWELRVLTV